LLIELEHPYAVNIITIPMPICTYGDGDDVEEGGARALADDRISHHPCINLSAETVQLSPEMRGGAMGKERCRSGAQSAYFFPTISCCSSGLPSRSAVRSQYSSIHLILAAIARTSESANVVPGRDVHDGSGRGFGYPSRRSYWALTNSS
jgi:hypothetical protein